MIIRAQRVTPRQELIKMSTARLRRWRHTKPSKIDRRGRRVALTAHDAVEAIIDESRGCEFGTMGSAMLSYYRRATDVAIDRLVSAVDRNAKEKR